MAPSFFKRVSKTISGLFSTVKTKSKKISKRISNRISKRISKKKVSFKPSSTKLLRKKRVTKVKKASLLRRNATYKGDPMAAYY